jgi:hypothetical protein
MGSTELELEAIARLAAARDLVKHVLRGQTTARPWVTASRGLIERAERLYRQAA